MLSCMHVYALLLRCLKLFNTATAMRQAGMVPTVKEQSSQGKTFWRVIVGPAANASERGVLLKKIKGIGFEDAYPVTN